jgi:hypothetical protein
VAVTGFPPITEEALRLKLDTAGTLALFNRPPDIAKDGAITIKIQRSMFLEAEMGALAGPKADLFDLDFITSPISSAQVGPCLSMISRKRELS